MPRYRCACLVVFALREIAIIGHRGRYRDVAYAERPLVVNTMIAEAEHFNDAFTAAIAVAVIESTGDSVRTLS